MGDSIRENIIGGVQGNIEFVIENGDIKSVIKYYNNEDNYETELAFLSYCNKNKILENNLPRIINNEYCTIEMSYCGQTLGSLLENPCLKREEQIEIILQVIIVHMTLVEKLNIINVDLHSGNICIEKAKAGERFKFNFKMNLEDEYNVTFYSRYKVSFIDFCNIDKAVDNRECPRELKEKLLAINNKSRTLKSRSRKSGTIISGRIYYNYIRELGNVLELIGKRNKLTGMIDKIINNSGSYLETFRYLFNIDEIKSYLKESNIPIDIIQYTNLTVSRVNLNQINVINCDNKTIIKRGRKRIYKNKEVRNKIYNIKRRKTLSGDEKLEEIYKLINYI